MQGRAVSVCVEGGRFTFTDAMGQRNHEFYLVKMGHLLNVKIWGSQMSGVDTWTLRVISVGRVTEDSMEEKEK